ncbi:hypothetical protein TNCV_4611621 [Trichonephila clavipes]|nr:hypothetical protein TNCV_4611621 [Trichonephila clavipes]
MLFLPQSDKHCIMPMLTERALLVKLYYRNSENAAASVKGFHHLKKQRRGPMSDYALIDMMVKFEKKMTARCSSWKRTKKSQYHYSRQYCYSGRGSKR